MNEKYLSYSVEALATDPTFKNWVLDPAPYKNSYWRSYIQQYPSQVKKIEEARLLVLATHSYFERESTNREILKLQFEEIIQRSNVQQRPRKKTTLITLRWKIVAAVAVFVCFASILWTTQFSNKLQSYSTGYAEWKTVELPDGSIVELNANTELTTAKKWGVGKDREVWLEGEAFFTVTKKPETKAKFCVHTNGVTVEVLGTSFNVNNKKTETEIYLEEGRIKLQAKNLNTIMQPGDLLYFSNDSQEIVENRRVAANEKPGSWKDGILILEDKTTKELLQRVEEIYGIKFRLENKELLSTKTTIRIPMDELELALPIIERALGYNLSQDAQGIWTLE